MKKLISALGWEMTRNSRFIEAYDKQNGTRQIAKLFPAYCPIDGAEKAYIRYNNGKLFMYAPEMYSMIEHLIKRHEDHGECLPAGAYGRLVELLEKIDICEEPRL